MSEENTQQREFMIQRIYTKDISFESPNAPMIFLEQWNPEVKVALNTETAALQDGNVEVVLTVNIEARQDDKVAFIIEIQQAGIFLARGFKQEEMAPLLGIGAPNALFPYAREVVSDLVSRGSLPQFVLQPVNFEAMYAQQQAKQKVH